MRLALIYCLWDDYELFKCSYRNMNSLADGTILVYSNTSNFGEMSNNKLNMSFKFGELIPYNFEPDLKLDARTNETNKRNFGIRIAKEKGFTHFLILDADEFYQPIQFLKEKKRIEDENLNGLVCRSKVYFRTPTLTIGYDTTLVPFIHKLDTAECIWNQNYPFAWTDTDGVPFTPKKRIRIDPTRQLNYTNGVTWSEIVMHHYSYIRSDLKRKIRNSTARANIEKSSLIPDYRDAKEGYFCKFYGKTLESCQNLFGVPELIDHDVTSLSASSAEKS